MNPIEIFKTIYLGDRSIKKIIIDGYNENVAIQFDLISKVPKGKSIWDFYSDEDIENGYLTFVSVRTIKILPLGAIANDYISSIDISEKGNSFLAIISAGGYDTNRNRCEVVIEIVFSELKIENNYE